MLLVQLAVLSVSPSPGPADSSFSQDHSEDSNAQHAELPSTSGLSGSPPSATASDPIEMPSVMMDSSPISPLSSLHSESSCGDPQSSSSSESSLSRSASPSPSESLSYSDDSSDDLPSGEQCSAPLFPNADYVSSHKDAFSPLYPDADITLCGALCAIMQFCQSNKLTYKATDELLKLLHILCPKSQLPSSFNKLRKFFQQFSGSCNLKTICTKCNEEGCSCTSQSSTDTAHVAHMDIQKPLQNILSSKQKKIT